MSYSAATTVTSSRKRSTNLTAFLLVAAVVLFDVFRIGECRSLQDSQPQHQLSSQISLDYEKDLLLNDDEHLNDNVDDNTPGILTSPLVIETAEGTTINLPCKVTNGSLDEVALLWINGTKSIMTDTFPSSTDLRVKAGTSEDKLEHSLVIEQVTRWDSGLYTCKITSTPPVEITHTLRVTHPARILSVQSNSATEPLNSSVKKVVVKQGEPVQLVCNVVGFPTPTVQWTRKAKHHQQSQKNATPSLNQDQSTLSPQQPTPTKVSSTNEVRIEAASAHQHAGYYECIASNSFNADPTFTVRSGLDLEIEYPPEIAVVRRVVNTGETYTAELVCIVNSYPKPKVTWEKQLKTADLSSMWQPLSVDNPSNRYETFKLNSTATAEFMAKVQRTENVSIMPTGLAFGMKVKQVQGPQDFGNYRCKAENKLGISHSEAISLTGTPARPRSAYVHSITLSTEGKSPELGWTVDSWAPLLKYQLQYRKQEDSLTSWTDVQPEPSVSEPSSNAGDEHKYTTSYVFGGNGHPTNVVPLQPGITYVARLRASNVHGWSEWSEDVVFSGGIDVDQEGNEINQNDGQHHVIKAAAGANGASGRLEQSCSAIAAMVLTAILVAAASVC